MVTVDDVAATVVTRMAAVIAFGDAVPGGLFLARGPDVPDAYPYCVFRVEPGEPRLTSGAPYWQPFTVRLAAYCPVGLAGSDPAVVQEALNEAFGTAAAQTALRAATLRNGSEVVLHSRPLPPTGEFAPQLREGRDVFAAGASFELLVQGDRSVS